MAVKFLIGEDEIGELGVQTEYLAEFKDVFENENHSNLLSELINTLPFIISTGRETKIAAGKQLNNVDGLELYGQLTIEGSLVI